MGLKISAAVYSHIGHRTNNEDNFYLNGLYMEREQMNKGGQFQSVYTNEAQIYAVCDGMGGAELGEEASLRAVLALKDFQQKTKQPDSTVYLDEMISHASELVDDISISRGRPSGESGSTIAMLVMKDWYFRTVHVGDSRVYLFRDGELQRITKDDSEVQQMVDRGEITLDEAWVHPRKNVITRHLGMPTGGAKLLPSVSPRQDLHAGDRFVICSDGLSDEVHDSVIREILGEKKSSADTAAKLVRTALSSADAAGYPSDNVTVILLDVLTAGDRDKDEKRVRSMKLIQKILGAASVLLLGGLGYSLYLLMQLLQK